MHVGQMVQCVLIHHYCLSYIKTEETEMKMIGFMRRTAGYTFLDYRRNEEIMRELQISQ
jgi:hypothetical protein